MGHGETWSTRFVSVTNGGGGITRVCEMVSRCSLWRCSVDSHSGKGGKSPLMSRRQWSYYNQVFACVLWGMYIHAAVYPENSLQDPVLHIFHMGPGD